MLFYQTYAHHDATFLDKIASIRNRTFFWEVSRSSIGAKGVDVGRSDEGIQSRLLISLLKTAK
jgi:hypothetical protein